MAVLASWEIVESAWQGQAWTFVSLFIKAASDKAAKSTMKRSRGILAPLRERANRVKPPDIPRQNR